MDRLLTRALSATPLTLQAKEAVLEFMRYGLIGAGLTLFNWSLLGLLFSEGVHYLPATLMAWVPSVALSFVLNKKRTFRLETDADKAEISRYAAATVLQLLTSIAGIAVLIDCLGLDWPIAFCINVVFGAVCNFFVLKALVFRVRLRPRR